MRIESTVDKPIVHQSQKPKSVGTDSAVRKSQKSPEVIKKMGKEIEIRSKKNVSNNDLQLTIEEHNEEKEKEVIQAIEKANAHIKTMDRRLEFSIHDATKQIMVKVIDTEDESIIREIPSEKVLDMVASMWELAGILVDEKI